LGQWIQIGNPDPDAGSSKRFPKRKKYIDEKFMFEELSKDLEEFSGA
jgi:hypothetical protein